MGTSWMCKLQKQKNLIYTEYYVNKGINRFDSQRVRPE